MKVTCPNCNNSCDNDLSTWDDSPTIPFFCSFCEEFNWVMIKADEVVIVGLSSQVPLRIPALNLSSQVYINNSQHEFFLERGMIVDKDHDYYRVLFSSMDDRISDKKLWVPEHWIKQIPKELE